jgi:RNA polymerase sigma-70 factor (ECF subfamily)
MPSVGERTNADWLRDLKESGPRNRDALLALRGVLIRRLGKALGGRGIDESSLEDFAQDAIVRILGSLDGFRGDSKFTTWATVIALRVAYSDLRRARWKDRRLEDLEADHWLADSSPDPEGALDRRSLAATLQKTIERGLTPRQRFAIMATLQGVPLATVAEHLGSSLNTLYKVHHDARLKIRRGILEAGYQEDEVRRILDMPSKER